MTKEGEKMENNKTQYYQCASFTAANDKANIYYINVSSARTIRANGKTIEVLNKRNTILAIFAY